MLVRLARAGHRVVRLKGGDRFVFGRGGEEALHLVRQGADFEVVPGITAALACGASAGIPLTHRGLARHLHFVAGHCRGDVPLDLNWKALADPDATLVFYMARSNLGEIRKQLLKANLPGDTPAALVECGTTHRQRCVNTTLDDIVGNKMIANPYRIEGASEIEQRFPVRRIRLDDYLDDFFFDPTYEHIIDAARNAKKSTTSTIRSRARAAPATESPLPALDLRQCTPCTRRP